MASEATPITANPKMMEVCNQTAQSTAHHTCAQDGYFKHPHTPIIDGYKWLDSGWFFLGFGMGGRLTSKKTHPDHRGRCCPMDAMVPPPPGTATHNNHQT